MKKKKDYFSNSVMAGAITVLLVVVIVLVYLFPSHLRSTLSAINDAGIQFASIILRHNFRSVAQIKSHYDSPRSKVRVLIVPGHEPSFGGAEFGDAKERDMALELGQGLQKILESDSHYQVFITRDAQGWNPIFASYFQDYLGEIAEWSKASHDEFSRLVSIGSTTRSYSTVTHNDAPQDVALRLYGMTKWSNENKIDIVIHIHFNDNTRRNVRRPGEYSGFSMYVPAQQYGNSTTTRVIADGIFKRLAKYNPVSDLPEESEGIINEPELIAVGSNNTADAASVLIEYSYIYEQQFRDPQVRSMAIKDLAFQTYLGLQDFFDPKNSSMLAKTYDTSILPYTWGNPLVDNTVATADVFALQTALMFDAVYPPSGKSKNECPRTGMFGNCTKTSLNIFQEKHKIDGENGIAGEKTLQVLRHI